MIGPRYRAVRKGESSGMTTQTSEQAAIDGVRKQLFIGGEWRDAAEGGTLAVEDPSTGENLCEVADAQPDDALAAIEAAGVAQADWAKHPPRQRGEILRRAFEIITERIDELALLMTLEMGKPIEDSQAEITYASEFFRWYSEEAVRIAGSYSISPDGNQRIMTMKQPVGPCLMITPWNFPMAMGTRKIGPAATQADLYGFDAGRASAHGAGFGEPPSGLDGARRQRALPHLRGRGRG